VALWRIADHIATSTIKFLSTFFELIERKATESNHLGRRACVDKSHSEKMYEYSSNIGKIEFLLKELHG
jgi:hypothetical protein